MLTFLVITNLIFNIFFGFICAVIGFQLIKNWKKINVK